MEEKTVPEKIKWRLNLFDIIFIVIVLLAALIVINYSGRSGGSVISSGAQGTVTYTIELNDMYGDTAYLIQTGDELVDKVEKRNMGTVVSVDVIPAKRLEKNDITGDRVISDYLGRSNAIVIIKAEATVTENQISIPGGFIVRAGVRVSVNGPLYHATGYIIDVERSDAP